MSNAEENKKKNKSGKLSFKGEKEHRFVVGVLRPEIGELLAYAFSTSCRKKKRKADDSEREIVGNIQEEGWVPVETLDDLVGPLFLTFPSDPPTSICTDDQDRLLIYPLPSSSSSSSTHPEPTIVQQVFVGARIVGSSSAFSLKSSSGHYLTSDRFGAVSADREAIGPQEEWNPAVTEAGVAWQSAMYGKFLAVDEIAGGGYKIRADAEAVGFCETWRVLCQARFKKKLKIDKGEVKKAAEIEVDNMCGALGPAGFRSSASLLTI
ncbi:hypothetical protein BC937DRAFT_87597 [Endogone sp. FLAS-F59071]|nr:hypothetical protein BC937DRAFT_87597 [Endogone sp. FLAS-F59071]|eukprot:RUS19366.1 hypothetical protein BC937DRAFT_87597 [Endogone sp. FLAS-F59071]